ncbi:MAG: DUF4328 domain-containing protein [Dehalococcoidia bacterium]
MFCISCGTRLPDDAGYCSSCGRVTHHPEGDPTAAAAATNDPAPAADARTISPAPNMAGTARTWSEAGGIPYLWSSRWWSRGPSGEVVVWDAAHDNWDIALSTQTPFFMKRPRFTSLKTPAIWTSVLLGFFMLASVLAVVADIDQAYLASQIRDGKSVSENELEDSWTLFEAMKSLQVLALISTAPLFIWWMQRSVANLPGLGSNGQQHSRGWAIGWWFIPFANLVQPLRVLLEVWRGSGSRSVLEPDESWRSRPNDPVMVIWWLGCVVGWLVANFLVSRLDGLDLADPDRMGWAIAASCVDAALILLAGLAIMVVMRLTRRQEQANEQFDVPSGTPASGPANAAAQPA